MIKVKEARFKDHVNVEDVFKQQPSKLSSWSAPRWNIYLYLQPLWEISPLKLTFQCPKEMNDAYCHHTQDNRYHSFKYSTQGTSMTRPTIRDNFCGGLVIDFSLTKMNFISFSSHVICFKAYCRIIFQRSRLFD